MARESVEVVCKHRRVQVTLHVWSASQLFNVQHDGDNYAESVQPGAGYSKGRTGTQKLTRIKVFDVESLERVCSTCM